MDRKEKVGFETDIDPKVVAVNLLWDMSTFMENPHKVISLLDRIKNHKADNYDIFIAKIMKSRLNNLPQNNTFKKVEKILENIA